MDKTKVKRSAFRTFGASKIGPFTKIINYKTAKTKS